MSVTLHSHQEIHQREDCVGREFHLSSKIPGAMTSFQPVDSHMQIHTGVLTGQTTEVKDGHVVSDHHLVKTQNLKLA